MAEKKKTSGKTKRPAGGAAAANPTDVGYMEQIARLMAANDLNTVDVRDGDRRVILKRGQAVVSVAGLPAGMSSLPPAGYAPAAPQPAAGAAPPAAAGDDAGLVPIKSPMVGTFYASPKPGEKPFVAVGSRVARDETDVCIIEAMKTFNVHKSDVTGTVSKILIQDGQTVQFDQPLFLVKPD